MSIVFIYFFIILFSFFEDRIIIVLWKKKISEVLPFYKDLRTSDQLAIRELPIRNVLKGDTISRCSGILCVIKGVLRVYIINDKGKEMTLYRLFDNDVCVYLDLVV